MGGGALSRAANPTKGAGRRWGAALASVAVALLVEEFVVYPLLVPRGLPDVWDLSWPVQVAYLGPELLACVLGGALMTSGRAVVLFGFASSAIRAALHAVQTIRGADGYLQAQETLPLALPVMLVTFTLVYAALAAVARTISARGSPRGAGSSAAPGATQTDRSR